MHSFARLCHFSLLFLVKFRKSQVGVLRSVEAIPFLGHPKVRQLVYGATGNPPPACTEATKNVGDHTTMTWRNEGFGEMPSPWQASHPNSLSLVVWSRDCPYGDDSKVRANSGIELMMT